MLTQFQNDDKDFQLMQNSWASLLNPIIQQVTNSGVYKEIIVNTPSNVTANGTYMDCTSLPVPKGDWLLTASLTFNNNGATITTNPLIGISTTPGNTSVGLQAGVNLLALGVASSSTPTSNSITNYRQLISTPTTYYLKLTVSSTTATPTYTCRLSAVLLRATS